MTQALEFLVPVEGLIIAADADIGPVRLLQPERAREIAERQPRITHALVEKFEKGLESGAALVTAETPVKALDLTASAIAVLRVFHQTITVMETPQFGIPGDAWSAVVPYLVVNQTVSAGGWTRRGHYRGATFNADQCQALAASAGFQLAASAIGSPDPTEGQRRALLGIDLASRAVLETRSDMKLMYAVLAAEAMLLEKSTYSQSLRLARRCAFLLCGRPQNYLCGRDRPTCPLLSITPETDRGRKKLERRAHLCTSSARSSTGTTTAPPSPTEDAQSSPRRKRVAPPSGSPIASSHKPSTGSPTIPTSPSKISRQQSLPSPSHPATPTACTSPTPTFRPCWLGQSRRT